MTRRLLAEWKSLHEATKVDGMSEEQTRDMQRCFFAGALSLRNILFNNTSEGDEITKEDENLIQELSAELEEYGEGVVLDPEKFMW
jgi:hypothetical protein